MEIIEYTSQYKEDAKDLLVELQEHIVSLDKDHYNIITKDYREKYLQKTLKEVKKYKGKFLLAKEKEKIIGLIVGLINNEEESAYDFKAPKRGRVTELVVKKGLRSKGVGKKLLEEMEKYFASVGCKGVVIGVFAYNHRATDFYYQNGYFDRYLEVMKKIEK